MNPFNYKIYAISDATGEMAMNIAFAAMRQFKVENVSIIRKSKVLDAQKIKQVILEAKKNHGILIYTHVSEDHRKIIQDYAEEEAVVAVDIMGPILQVLSTYFQSTPSDEPGLKYRHTKEYFKRQEAIEFTVKHDDGLGKDSLEKADIILLGISRTSKTPLSIYLAYRGYKVANIPIVQGIELPEEIYKVDRKKMLGLTIQSQKLIQYRETRLLKLGRPLTEEYASASHVNGELEFAKVLFESLGDIPIIDVSDKAIEEIASEILVVLGK